MSAPTPSKPWPRWLDLILVAVFLAALVAPGLVMIGRPRTAAGTAQYRALKQRLRESHGVVDKVHAWKDWFATRFGFRDRLIEARAIIRVKGLGVSTSDQVVLGKEGWLFYAGEHSLDSYRRLSPFSPDELRAWERMLDTWSARAKLVGAPLIVMIPPDKSTVYPDLMPAWATVADRKSRLDQLAAILSHRTDLDFVDVRPQLEELRHGAFPLYYRTDSHWNVLGSYIAARELARALARRFPAVVVPPPPIGARSVVLHERGGDLSRLLGLAWLDDEDVEITLPPAQATIHSSSDLATRDMHIENAMSSTRPNAAIPRALVFRDSFSTAMIKHLAEHFGAALYVWSTFVDPAQIQTIHPDVIVVEIVERDLMKDPAAILEGK